MDRETLPLWKIVLGVALGVLLADLVRMAWVALTVGALLGSWGVSTKNPGKITERKPAAVQAQQLPTYEGPITAREYSISRACINGTIADRQGNGWAQALADGRPQPCRATSQ